MDTWDAIRSRRNVRTYADRPLSRGDLEQILEAGRRSPSSTNWQPWHFVVVADRQQLADLSQAWKGAGHVAGSAATVALVARAPDDEMRQNWLQYDFGQATAYMMLAAADLGVGSGHAAVGDQSIARRVLGFPEGYVCLYLLAFGYPDDRPLAPLRRPDRRAFDDVVHWDRWSRE
ncbi:MAG: nitroreductase family protein [Acidimicrobiales bacterium]